MARINLQQAKDLDGHIVAKVLDQFEFCIKSASEDMSITPFYYLYARPVGDFMIQKHYIDGGGMENMQYYYSPNYDSQDPRTVFENDRETLTYQDFWEVF